MPRPSEDGAGVGLSLPGGGLQAHGLHEHLQVLPRLLLRGRVAEQVGGVVGDDRGDAPVAVPPAAEPAHRQGRLQQRRGGGLAQQAEELGPDDRDLALEERQAVRRPRRGAGRGSRGGATSGCWRCRPPRARPIPLVIMSVSRTPARPTKGRPVRSSSAPGASPMNISRAVGRPSPKTVRVRRRRQQRALLARGDLRRQRQEPLGSLGGGTGGGLELGLAEQRGTGHGPSGQDRRGRGGAAEPCVPPGSGCPEGGEARLGGNGPGRRGSAARRPRRGRRRAEPAGSRRPGCGRAPRAGATPAVGGPRGSIGPGGVHSSVTAKAPPEMKIGEWTSRTSIADGLRQARGPGPRGESRRQRPPVFAGRFPGSRRPVRPVQLLQLPVMSRAPRS